MPECPGMLKSGTVWRTLGSCPLSRVMAGLYSTDDLLFVRELDLPSVDSFSASVHRSRPEE